MQCAVYLLVLCQCAHDEGDVHHRHDDQVGALQIKITFVINSRGEATNILLTADNPFLQNNMIWGVSIDKLYPDRQC